MSIPLTLSVPCSLVVHQYYKHHGFDALFHALLRMVSEKTYLPSSEPLPERICYHLKVPVTVDKVYRDGYNLNNRAVIQLNIILESIMRDQIRKSFLDELASCRRSGTKLRIKPFIDDILIRMGISEEAKSFDTVKKDLQRFCEAQKIDYQALKKVRKNVPKLRRNSPNSPTDGIPLKEYLRSRGIVRSTFFLSHKPKLRTFIYKHRLFIHLDNFTHEELYFSELG